MVKVKTKVSWLPMVVLVSRVARYLGCAPEDAGLRIVEAGEADRIRACGLTVKGWPASPLSASWRVVADWDAGQLSELANVELCLDDVIAADLLPAAERTRWPAAMALAYIIEGLPLEWKEWQHWRARSGLSEMGPLIEKAGMDLASAIGADQVLAWGRLTSQGQMELLPGSDLRVEGFVWVVRPDGELGTSPPGQLAVFLIAQHEQGLKERRWCGIEIDPKGLERAFLKPLPGGRRVLHDAEELYAETMPKLAPLVESEPAPSPKPSEATPAPQHVVGPSDQRASQPSTELPATALPKNRGGAPDKWAWERLIPVLKKTKQGQPFQDMAAFEEFCRDNVQPTDRKAERGNDPDPRSVKAAIIRYRLADYVAFKPPDADMQ